VLGSVELEEEVRLIRSPLCQGHIMAR
jgi:hypothetical protein